MSNKKSTCRKQRTFFLKNLVILTVYTIQGFASEVSIFLQNIKHIVHCLTKLNIHI